MRGVTGKMRNAMGAVLLTLGAGLAGPAQAECMGGCMDGLVGALVALLVYGVIGLAVLIMLIRQKWRRGGLRLLVGTMVIAFGVPLISQGWQAWRLHGTISREVAGQPPALQGRVPLLIDDGYYVCGYGPCAPVLWSLGEAGAYGLPFEALAGLDLTKPIPLADLPLQFWKYSTDGTGTIRSRPLTPAERQEAATRIDYLILAQQDYFNEDFGPVELALRQSPALADLRVDERVHLLMAPLVGGKLAVSDLDFDVLDLTLTKRALAFPLAPYNTQAAANGIASQEALLSLFCPAGGAMEMWSCQNDLN